MDKKNRGHALIINVQDVQGQKPRLGTDIDRDKLEALWEQLNFRNITVYNDEDGLTAQVTVAMVTVALLGMEHLDLLRLSVH